MKASLDLVECFITPRIRLFLEVTGTATQNKSILQKLFNSAVKTVSNLCKYDRISDLYDSFYQVISESQVGSFKLMSIFNSFCLQFT